MISILGWNEDGSWGFLSLSFMYLFLSEILTQIALLYHITQTFHDLLFKFSWITSSKWPFWKLIVLAGLTMGVVSLTCLISVSIFEIEKS